MTGFVPPGPGQPPEEPVGPTPGRPDPPTYGGYPSYRAGPPGPDVSRALVRAESSRKMSGWALGLALVVCIPLLPVVGLILGIVVLVRSREGGDHGKGKAIAAVVIGGIYLAAFVGLFVYGIVEGVREAIEGPDRDESGQLEEPGDIYVDQLRIGDCVSSFERVEDVAPDEDPTGMATVVRCDEPHLAEVFHRFVIDPGDYPNQAALDRASVDGCIAEFDRYVGKDFQRSTLELNYYNPTKGEGLFEGDRVICLVTGPSLSSEMLEGSRR